MNVSLVLLAVVVSDVKFTILDLDQMAVNHVTAMQKVHYHCSVREMDAVNAKKALLEFAVTSVRKITTTTEPGQDVRSAHHVTDLLRIR